MKYELNQLGSQKFEELVQGLASAEYGFEGKIYGKGPDGQREFTMEQDGLSFGYIQTKGYTVGQAKFKGPDTRLGDIPWLKRNLKEELEGFRKKHQAGDRIPDTWLFFTNVTLTAVAKTGGRGVIEQYLTDGGYREAIPNIHILAADDILSLLNARPEIAKHYAQFLTSGDVLAELILHLEAEQRKQEAFLSLLAKRLEQTRTDHPSFTLMRPDELDRRLFPRFETAKPLPAMGSVGEESVSPVWKRIVQSWQEGRRHIVLEGDGGIGKTVALLSPEGEARTIPALYIPLFQMVNGDTVFEVADYLKRELDDYYPQFLELSRRPWLSKPSILLLLDGVNELPTLHRRQVVEGWKKWAEDYDYEGTQLVAVSRPLDKITLDLGNALGKASIYLKLTRISRETAKDYLKELGREIPADNAPIWEVLTLPLFLVLYAKTGTLDELTACNYPLAPKPAANGGTLIWNYLQRELLRKKNDENWVLQCAVACEYLLPAVGYEMVKNHWFTITMEKLDEVLQKAQACLTGPLPRHLRELYQNYDIIHEGRPAFDGVKWRSLLIHEIGLLTRNQGSKNSCSFIHQHFRDCFAGLHLVNAVEAEGGLPELWRHSQPPLAMEYAAQLMKEETAQGMWEALLRLWPTDRGLLYTQLELHRRRVEGLSRLDFSNMDLRGVSLARYGKGLFRNPDFTKGTQVDEAVFQGVGHSGTVECVATLPDGRIVSGSYRTLQVWDSYTGDCLKVILVSDTPKKLKYDASEGRIVFQLCDDSIMCCDPDRGEPKKLKGTHPFFEEDVILQDGRLVKHSGQKILLCSPDGKQVTALKGHKLPVTCVAVLPDGRIVSGSADRTLLIWSPKGGPSLACLGRIEPVVYNLNPVGEDQWVSGHRDGTLRLWNRSDGHCQLVMTVHGGGITCVAVLPSGRIVIGCSDETIKVWDLDTGDCLRVITVGERVSSIWYDSAKCRIVLRLGNNNTLWSCNPDSGKLERLEGPHPAFHEKATLSDGRIVKVIEKVVHVCSPDGQPVKRLMMLAPPDACVLPLGKNRILGSLGRTLRLWSADTGKCLAIIPVSEMDLTGMNLSQADYPPELAEMLYYNGAKVSSADEERIRKQFAEP